MSVKAILKCKTCFFILICFAQPSMSLNNLINFRNQSVNTPISNSIDIWQFVQKFHGVCSRKCQLDAYGAVLAFGSYHKIKKNDFSSRPRWNNLAIQCGNLKCMLINVIDFLSLHIHFRIVKVNVVFSLIHTKYDFQR